jgi:hypothetical protein
MDRKVVENIQNKIKIFKTLDSKDLREAIGLLNKGKSEKEVFECLKTWEKSNLLIKYMDSCTN